MRGASVSAGRPGVRSCSRGTSASPPQTARGPAPATRLEEAPVMTRRPAADGSSPVLTPSQRFERMLGWLSEEGRLDVGDAAIRLGVAQETIRRDLRVLES